MAAVTYVVRWTETAVERLDAISDPRVRRIVYDRAGALARDPESQGKALLGELDGFRSIRAIGQRYRIIYRVQRQEIVVIIVTVGLRKEGDKRDVYALARKLLKQGLLN